MADELDNLLAIQDLDTSIDVLRHRLEVLPERAELQARHEALIAIERDLAPVTEERHRLERAQKALEDELAALAEKRGNVEAQLYAGGSSNAKELQALQDELDSFDRRRGVLEDQVLELLLEAEPLDEQLTGTVEQREALDSDAVALTARLAEAEVGIDTEVTQFTEQRASLAGSLDPALLARYERLRTRMKGVGVGRLEGAKCTGCHLTLPAAQAEAVRRQARDEGIAECPECDRLLVV